MKKLLFIFSFILFLSSCTQQEEVCYSCDSEIDAWVKTNKTELSEMSREEYSKLDITKQKAAYVSFTSEKRKQFWTEKMDELIKEIPFTSEEKKHLKYMENIIKTHKFGHVFTAKKSKEIMNWMKEGQSKFGWSDKFLYNAFFRVSLYNKLALYGGGLDSKDCNCNYSIFCWANNAGSCDSSGDSCTKTQGGCGALIELSCEGICG